jgi:uncharacterized protein YutE (UPF0331/DUF86 family)
MSPAQIDDQVVRRHLLALRRAVDGRQKHVGHPVEALSESSDELWAVERGVQLCAQNALDIAIHIAASAGHDVPDYASAIDTLAEIEVVPREFAKRFRSVAGFRNILVHGYLDVDIAILHRTLNTRLGDFTEFAGYIEGFLQRP